jgi:hypothetical protein
VHDTDALGLRIAVLAAALLCGPFAVAGEAQPRSPIAGGGSAQPSLVSVSGRLLTGLHSLPQRRGGRVFLPVAAIARALGDQIDIDHAAQRVRVQRQTGIAAEFQSALGQVLENGSTVLRITTTADIVFPPNGDELMLPIEIVSALLDVAVVVGEGQSIDVRRGAAVSQAVRAGASRGAWDVHQVEHDYALNASGTAINQSLALRSTGRYGAGRFSLLTQSSGDSASEVGVPRRGTFTYTRQSGHELTAGDFGTGSDLQFMSSAVRGVSFHFPARGASIRTFAGQAASGQARLGPPDEDIATSFSGLDTRVFGGVIAFGAGSNPARQGRWTMTSGMIHFDGANRGGDMLAGSVRRQGSRAELHGDVAFGRFAGFRQADQVDGSGGAINLAASLKAGDRLVVFGRYGSVSRNFLEPSGSANTHSLQISAGASSRLRPWLDASVAFSTSASLATPDQREPSGSATVRVSPGGRFPTVFFSRTESKSSMLGKRGFTLLNVTKEYQRWRWFSNTTHTQLVGTATFNTQAGVGVRIGTSNLHGSHGLAGNGARNGQLDWYAPDFFSDRLAFGLGIGYTAGPREASRVNTRLSGSLRISRDHALQFTYASTGSSPQLMLSLTGALLRRRAEVGVAAPAIEALESESSFSGRIYQDININGQFDPDIDRPQTHVTVRVDGNRSVVSDGSGQFKIDGVKPGSHAVYVDLLTVRADLTALDGLRRTVMLTTEREAIVDFRFVRTGRLSGRVWFDKNGNGELDPGEPTLSEVRVVTSSARDTLTNAEGSFVIADLPPGEYSVLVDEKTLPATSMRSPLGSRTVTIRPGAETAGALFPIREEEAEIKRFKRPGG